MCLNFSFLQAHPLLPAPLDVEAISPYFWPSQWDFLSPQSLGDKRVSEHLAQCQYPISYWRNALASPASPESNWKNISTGLVIRALHFNSSSLPILYHLFSGVQNHITRTAGWTQITGTLSVWPSFTSVIVQSDFQTIQRMFPFAERMISLFTFGSFDGQGKQFIITAAWPEEAKEKKRTQEEENRWRERQRFSHHSSHSGNLRATSMNGVPGRRRGQSNNQKHRGSLSVFPLRLNPRGDATALSMWHTQNTPCPIGAWAPLPSSNC